MKRRGIPWNRRYAAAALGLAAALNSMRGAGDTDVTRITGVVLLHSTRKPLAGVWVDCINGREHFGDQKNPSGTTYTEKDGLFNIINVPRQIGACRVEAVGQVGNVVYYGQSEARIYGDSSGTAVLQSLPATPKGTRGAITLGVFPHATLFTAPNLDVGFLSAFMIISISVTFQ